MIAIIRNSGILIPKIFEKEKFFIDITSALTRKVKQYQSELLITQKFYAESDNYIIIPRFFPVQNYFNCEILDKFKKGKKINIEHNIEPRNELQKAAIDFMLNNKSGILQLKPGSGKTVIAIYAMSNIKEKTLILVHRDALEEQWKERILGFTNLEKDKIGILKSSNFEDILIKSSVIITTNQTFLSLLKRNKERFLSVLYNCGLGLFIADEVHTTVGAETFSNCSIHIPSERVFGLSATPYRNDGNSDIITFHLGKILKLDSNEGVMQPRVNVIGLDYGIDIPRRKNYLFYDSNFQRSRYLNIMKNSEIFMSVVKSLINKVIKENRKTIVICERIEKLIDILFDWCQYENKSKFIAGSSRDELKKNIIFSTPGKIRDGVDAVWLDTLIITSPVSNMEQLSGRINRVSEGKETPIIIDMVDIGCKPIRKTFFERLKFYKTNDWDVKFIYIDNMYGKKQIDETEFLSML